MDSYTLTILIENIKNLSEAVQYLIDFTEEIHEVNQWSGAKEILCLKIN